MIHVLLAAGALSTLAPAGRAGEAAVRLTVTPMPAPTPALRYQLLPEVRELNPGNPAQGYVRCFAEQRYFFFSKEGTAERARYLSLPLADLPADKLRGYGGQALRHADWSARLDTLDWEVLRRVQTEGTDLLLPELGPLRVLAAALKVRFRAEVAGGHYDDAVRTAKTLFALARHLGEYPTTAATQVGLSVADLTLDTLEELVARPGCPNLYWALTDLPCPLVEVRKGFQGDRALVDAELGRIRDDAPVTETRLEEVVARLSGGLGFAREQAGRRPHSLRAGLAARVADPERVVAARRRLVAAGWPEDRAREFPPAQVILLDEKRDYEIRRDERMKLVALAPWQIDAPAGGGEDGLFAELLPAVVPLRQAQGRLEQRVALLRHVEAVRLYAAGHGGAVPGSLAEIPVPLPVDPFTGRAFVYAVDGNTAVVRGTPPRAGDNPASAARYEITIRK